VLCDVSSSLVLDPASKLLLTKAILVGNLSWKRLHTMLFTFHGTLQVRTSLISILKSSLPVAGPLLPFVQSAAAVYPLAVQQLYHQLCSIRFFQRSSEHCQERFQCQHNTFRPITGICYRTIPVFYQHIKTRKNLHKIVRSRSVIAPKIDLWTIPQSKLDAVPKPTYLVVFWITQQ
jgi:hypothetical protein